MRKFYVTFGNYQRVLHASNTIHACILVYKSMAGGEFWVDNIHTSFRVSERGFDVHDDDEVYDANEIIKILMVAAQECDLDEN